MNLNPVEWSQAQDLLLKLVQVLTPLTERIVPASFFLSKRFVIPSGLVQEDSQSVPLRHPVRILSALHTVQKEVEKWIAAASHEVEEKKEASIPKEAPPVSKQAQKLIREVQKAIGELASSTYMQDPTEAPLRAALKKLKPTLDGIIDSIAHEKEAEQAPPRHTPPRSPRDYIFAKLDSYPKPIPQKELVKEGIEQKPLKVEIELKIIPKPFEAIALPGAPFISQPKNLIAHRKKKKRKGFWFKGKEDLEDRNNS